METPSDRVTPFPVLVTRTVTLGAVLWTLSIVFFVVQIIAQAASSRPYSLATNLISDLGNTACGPAVCSPLHTLVRLGTQESCRCPYETFMALSPLASPQVTSIGQLPKVVFVPTNHVHETLPEALVVFA